MIGLLDQQIDGKTMTAIFYDKDKTPIKTIHFGATSSPDYTEAPHDEERRSTYIHIHKEKREWGVIICLRLRYQAVVYVNINHSPLLIIIIKRKSIQYDQHKKLAQK